MRARRAWMKGGTRASWVRRARLPSFPVSQLSHRVLGGSVPFVAAGGGEGRVGVGVGVELQMIVASKVAELFGLVEQRKMLRVGRICTGPSPLSASCLFSSSRSLCISPGKSSSPVPSSSFSCRQKRFGVSPCAQLSLSSAAPCTYFPSEASGRSMKRDAVRQITL